MTTRITVLGSGLVGSAIIKDLASEPSFSILAVDLSEESLGRVAGLDRVQTRQGSVQNEDFLAEVCLNADLVVSAVPGFMGFECLKNLIDLKKNVVDISFFPEDAFELNQLALDHNVTAVVDCGVAAHIEDFTSVELSNIRYRGTDQSVLNFDEALAACTELGLGVMLDIKTPDASPLPAPYLKHITDLIDEYALSNGIMTLCMRPEVRAALPDTTLWPIRANNLQAALSSDKSLRNHFWFDDPDSATDEEIRQIGEQGALTIACLNSFRYPHHSFNQLEEVDAKRMKALTVDGFQIDSCYGIFFEKLASA